LLETADGQAYEPRVAMGADGNGIAIWYQQSAGHLGTWSARYRPRHGWSSPELLHHDDSFDDVLPSLEIDAHGNALAIWLQTTGYVYTARYDHAQAAWQPANWISAASSSIGYHSSLSFDADGNAMAIWYQGDGSHSHVWTRRFQ